MPRKPSRTTAQFERLTAKIRDARMQAIYQPAMIKALLENGNQATRRTVARHLMTHDLEMVQDYEKITDRPVGKVLRDNGVVTKEGALYTLLEADALTVHQVQTLIAQCDARISDFIAKRGQKTKDTGPVRGSVRYEVLKRAHGRCELCGCPADLRMLHVDHIDPKSKGGSNDLDNLQALCDLCNANKGNRDATDFRTWAKERTNVQAGCLFCEDAASRCIAHSDVAYARSDKYAVTESHTLIIPKRHVASYDDLHPYEIHDCHALMARVRKKLLKADPSIVGFNVGINDGAAAGQTIFHVHMHLIPRREGDVKDPRGGIRHLIPGKGNYLKD